MKPENSSIGFSYDLSSRKSLTTSTHGQPSDRRISADPPDTKRSTARYYSIKKNCEWAKGSEARKSLSSDNIFFFFFGDGLFRPCPRCVIPEHECKTNWSATSLQSRLAAPLVISCPCQARGLAPAHSPTCVHNWPFSVIPEAEN